MEIKAPNIVQLEARVKLTTSKKHQQEISLIAEILNIYSKGYALMPPFKRTESNDVPYAWLLLTARSFNSMRSAVILMLVGYYGSALSLLRTVTEDWLVGTDCEDYKPTLETLLYEKHRFGDKKLKLRYKDIADRVTARLNTGKDFVYSGDYKFQSQFIHAGRLSLEIMRDRKMDELRITPSYDGLLFYTCCELLMRNSLKVKYHDV